MKLFNIECTPDQMEHYKQWALVHCMPDCPMPKWIPALEALPDTSKLQECAIEWQELIRASWGLWMEERKP